MDALTVSPAEAGQKLVNFLLRRVDAGQGEIQRWIRSGQVRINKGRAQPFARLDSGDAIRVPPFARLRPLAEAAPLLPDVPAFAPARGSFPYPDAVYEDDDIVVVRKNPGLPVQGGTGHSDSLAARLAAHYAGSAFVPAPAHRLDRDTSGLVAAGKTYAAQRSLSDAFAGKAQAGAGPAKDYLAWIWDGWEAAGLVELRDYLEKNRIEGRVKVTARDGGTGPGREARSLALGLRRLRLSGGDTASLLLIRILTGRTHQIRVQLAERGKPLVGDGKYGDRRRDRAHAVSGLMLHACRLALPQPFMREITLLPAWEGPWRVGELPNFGLLDVG